MVKEVSKQIYDLLKQNNFDVYFPSQHKGECISKYVVIKHDGVYQPLTVSSERPIYTITFTIRSSARWNWAVSLPKTWYM
mgnify:CR=1 FL=1